MEFAAVAGIVLGSWIATLQDEATVKTINTTTESIKVGPSESRYGSSSSAAAMHRQEGAPRGSRTPQDARTIRKVESQGFVQ